MNLKITAARLAAALGAFAAGTALALAVPPKPGTVDYTMSDGSKIAVTLHGDETSGYYTTADGHVLLPGKRGDLYYATLKDGAVARTNVRATTRNGLTINDVRFVETIDRDAVRQAADAARRQVASASRRLGAPRSAASSGGLDMITSYPTVGSPSALILLVEFKDVRFRTPDPQASFNALINERGYSHNGATGSAYDYFYENSGGLFTPDFQVYGPVTLDNNESYYGEAEGLARDRQAWKIVTEGCAKLREQHPELDFSQFDNDGDGFVDNVFVYYAGYGQNEGASSWTIWPHAANVYTFYGADVEYDGVKLGNYACTNELRGTSGTARAGIGTFCHEFSHILGLPDLYATNSSGGFTPGTFELMDVGPYNNEGNTPPYMSAFDRMSVGWLKVRDLTGPETVTLRPVNESEALRIPTEKDTEFFLLENRQKEGWDKYIQGHGMLVWHIDFNPEVWANNTVNNTASHMHVDIVEADGLPTAASRDGDPFPGTSRVTQFTGTSIPAMKTWLGVDPDMPLTDIRETDGLVTFKVKGGGERIAPVTATDATDITATSFAANWEGRPEIAGYEVDVCRGIEIVPFRTLTVRNATSVSVRDLQPATDYSYTVRAVDGSLKSDDSNTVALRTADATFDMLTTVALPATDVADNSFTANWEPMDDADAYELRVYEKEILDPEIHTADFTAADGSIVPDGWTTTSTMTDSRTGYFGQARPSLKMADRSRLQTPVFADDVNHVQFWCRGNRTADGDYVSVDALIGDAWTPLATAAVSADEGRIVRIASDAPVKMPSGVKAIRIGFTSPEGASLCVDDVEIGAGGTFVPHYVAGFDPMTAGTDPSMAVEGLRPSTTYYYTVRGLSSGLRSVGSDEIAVTTTDSSAASDALADADADATIVATPEGVEITNLTDAPLTAECLAPSGALLWIGRVAPGATVGVALPRNTITIVSCGSAVAKVLR